MRLIAVDKNGQIVAWLSPSNIQWQRKYYGAGQFSVQIITADYTKEMHSLYTPDRPEVGIIQRVDFTTGQGGSFVQLSGFFEEKILDDFVIAKSVKITQGISALAQGLIKSFAPEITVKPTAFTQTVSIDDLGTQLGTKLWEMLEPLELSYKLKKGQLSLWQGPDKTQAQSQNNRVTFSTAWGNAQNLAFSQDSSNYKNYGVIAGVNDLGDFVMAEYNAVKTGEKKRCAFIDATSVDSTYISTAELMAELKQYGKEKLISEHKLIEDISFDLIETEYLRYIKDFDLGDKVDVVIKELDRVYSARITEIMEIHKGNEMSVNITVGNKQQAKYKVYR